MLLTSKSVRKLSEGLGRMGHTIGRTLVGKLLHQLDYSLLANRKTREGSNRIDRDAQFHYINDRVKEALASGNPAISVDTKKKELVAISKTADGNGGRRVHPKKCASTTSSFPNSGEPCPMVSTTLPATPAGSVSASTMTPRLSQPTPFEAGGNRWVVSAIP
jgi:hypothetical protein